MKAEAMIASLQTTERLMLEVLDQLNDEFLHVSPNEAAAKTFRNVLTSIEICHNLLMELNPND